MAVGAVEHIGVAAVVEEGLDIEELHLEVEEEEDVCLVGIVDFAAKLEADLDTGNNVDLGLEVGFEYLGEVIVDNCNRDIESNKDGPVVAGIEKDLLEVLEVEDID